MLLILFPSSAFLSTAGIDPYAGTRSSGGLETWNETTIEDEDHQNDPHHEKGRSHNNSKSTTVHEEYDDGINNTPFGPSRGHRPLASKKQESHEDAIRK
jgi:hypothetical protein